MSDEQGFRALVGFNVEEADEGAVTATLEAGPAHLNPNGTVHGGVLTTLADASMGEAVATVVEGQPVAIALDISFLKPGQAGTLTASARVIRRGRTISLAQAQVFQDDDLIAHVVGTYSAKG